MKKLKITIGWLTTLVGAFLMLLSLFVYKYFNTGFIGEVHSEVFGVGAGLFVIGLALVIFKRRLA